MIVNNNEMDKPMNRIKEVLEERGIKQTWLAERLGKSFCMVNSYVCNCRKTNMGVLFEIAKILNVVPKELISNPKDEEAVDLNAIHNQLKETELAIIRAREEHNSFLSELGLPQII